MLPLAAGLLLDQPQGGAEGGVGPWLVFHVLSNLRQTKDVHPAFKDVLGEGGRCLRPGAGGKIPLTGPPPALISAQAEGFCFWSHQPEELMLDGIFTPSTPSAGRS